MLIVWLNVRKNNDKRMLSYSLYNTFQLAGLKQLIEPIRCVNEIEHKSNIFNEAVKSAEIIMLNRKLIPAEFTA
jgi:hypothetical protein